MFRPTIFFIFGFLILTIHAQRDRKKICKHNLVINGTNLIAAHRKQLLVIGIINFNNQSARIEANRWNDLYRELHQNDMRDSVVRLVLINEQTAGHALPGTYYDKIRLYQDNSKDHFLKKLNNNEQTRNIYVFGRCGYLIFTQEYPNSDLLDGKNYQELVRVITTAVKNKRRCQGVCS